MATLVQDLENFPWGKVIKVHDIGPYVLVEYVQQGITNSPTNGEIFFAGYIHCESVSQSWCSLEEALIGLIVLAKIGPNASAATALICRGLGIE